GNASTVIEPTSHLYLHPSDGTNSISVEKLNGSSNYRAWRRSFKIALASIKKLGFVTGGVKRDLTDKVKQECWEHREIFKQEKRILRCWQCIQKGNWPVQIVGRQDIWQTSAGHAKPVEKVGILIYDKCWTIVGYPSKGPRSFKGKGKDVSVKGPQIKRGARWNKGRQEGKMRASANACTQGEAISGTGITAE
ncbi:1-phosphatidylinositol 4 5-bisphosphate phosphodiesterase delta-3, partial [Bienertia sinuspersici]